MNSFFWITLYMHYYMGGVQENNERIREQASSIFSMKNILRFFITIGLLAFMGVLAVSRVYTGAHTIN